MQHRSCPICAGRKIAYAFSHDGYRVCRCDDCTFLFVNPQPPDEVLATIYNETYFIGSIAGESAIAQDVKRATARHYLQLMTLYGGPLRGRLLEIGCGRGEFILEAVAHGLEAVGVEYAEASASQARALAAGRAEIVTGDIDSANFPDESFDYCVFADVLEHVRDPAAFIERVWRVLKPGGLVFIATPSMDSPSARFMRENWVEFKLEHLSYFNRHTLDQLLHRHHFADIQTGAGYKVLTLDYIRSHFRRYPVKGLMGLLPGLLSLAPAGVRHRPRFFRASGIIACGRRAPRRPVRRLSIIVPVYNEAATVEELLRLLDAKVLEENMEKEIIVVESNSSDGSRAVVQRYAGRPGWKIILQEGARGKGHAVRAGLAAATGDYVLIQDSDLEYDLEDYDVLLEPLLAGRESFVLGARHGKRAWWKLRRFSDRPASALLLNFGHYLFATAINVLFGLRLRDPFTMYKVFRRDCIHGLTFSCDRFDFDYELLLKLVLRGHRPVEIAVNYRSRSFAEGKKVAFIRDPLLWIRALYRLRFRTPPSDLTSLARRARQGIVVAPAAARR